jgi:hypothetical protein
MGVGVFVQMIHDNKEQISNSCDWRPLLQISNGATHFTKLDIKVGYNQIKIAEEDIHKTTFRTHSGHYEWVDLPFELTEALGTFHNFQKLMKDIFRPYFRKIILIFLDDIMVYTSTWEENLGCLKITFQILEANSLVLNRKKCSFASKTVEYLGHMISVEGSTLPENQAGPILIPRKLPIMTKL